MDDVVLVHEEGVELHARLKAAQFLLPGPPRHDRLSGHDKERIAADQIQRPIHKGHTRGIEERMPRLAAVKTRPGIRVPIQQKIFPVHVHQPQADSGALLGDLGDDARFQVESAKKLFLCPFRL